MSGVTVFMEANQSNAMF